MLEEPAAVDHADLAAGVVVHVELSVAVALAGSLAALVSLISKYTLSLSLSLAKSPD